MMSTGEWKKIGGTFTGKTLAERIESSARSRPDLASRFARRFSGGTPHGNGNFPP